MPYAVEKSSKPASLAEFDQVNSADEIDLGPMTVSIEWFRARRTRSLLLRVLVMAEPPDNTGQEVWFSAAWRPV